MDDITFYDDGFFDQAITRDGYYRRLANGDKAVVDVNHYKPIGYQSDNSVTTRRSGYHMRSSA